MFFTHLVEDNVVGETSVVGPGDGFTLGNGDGGRFEDQSTWGEDDEKDGG